MTIDRSTPPASPSPHPHVVFTDLDGAEGVLVDLDTKQYFQLNASASVVWRGLAAGTPADGIAREMTAVYEVTLEHAQASVDAAIRELIALRLVRPAR
jgi:hypothetical protein